MRCGRFAIAGLLLLAACGSDEQLFAGQLEASVVYGNDDRLEVYAHPDPELQRIARESVIALIPASRLSVADNGAYQLLATDLRTQRNLCPDESFANQPVAATCSGVLIADDLVLTAGHCVSPSRPCDVFQYVFNYHLEAENTLSPIVESDVYSCRRVILDEESSTSLTPDFAIIQLDRPVTPDHVPVAIRSATPLEVNDPMSMIGAGSGLPTKIDDGAWVVEARTEQLDYYQVNLDAFEGHSGSATFDENARLAGILIGGRVPDYVVNPGEECTRVNTFDDSLAREFVHNIAPIVDALCQTEVASDDLCGDKACDGEPCGAPTVAAPIPSPPSGDGVASASSDGCSTAPMSSSPLALLASFGLCAIALRVRRKAV